MCYRKEGEEGGRDVSKSDAPNARAGQQGARWFSEVLLESRLVQIRASGDETLAPPSAETETRRILPTIAFRFNEVVKKKLFSNATRLRVLHPMTHPLG